MKIDKVKFIIAIAIALLLGFVCEILAPQSDGRNWISLAVGFLSIGALIVPAMSIKYPNPRRGVSIKTFAWIVVFIVTATNIIFSCFEYKIDVYAVIVLLLTLIGWGVLYALFSAKS